MKKLFFLLFGLFLSLNLSYASDLISKASNGVLNENSLGVKKLSDEEMKSVVGGWHFVGGPIGDYSSLRYDKWGNVVSGVVRATGRLYPDPEDSAWWQKAYLKICYNCYSDREGTRTNPYYTFTLYSYKSNTPITEFDIVNWTLKVAEYSYDEAIKRFGWGITSANRIDEMVYRAYQESSRNRY